MSGLIYRKLSKKTRRLYAIDLIIQKLENLKVTVQNNPTEKDDSENKGESPVEEPTSGDTRLNKEEETMEEIDE